MVQDLKVEERVDSGVSVAGLDNQGPRSSFHEHQGAGGRCLADPTHEGLSLEDWGVVIHVQNMDAVGGSRYEN